METKKDKPKIYRDDLKLEIITTQNEETILAPMLSDNEQPEAPIKEIKEENKSLKGYLFGILFALCSCMASVLIKKSPSLDGSNHAAIRYIFQLILMVLIVKKNNLPIFGPKAQLNLLIIRGIAGCLTVMIAFFSIKYLDISDVETLTNTSVLITAILAKIILKEQLTISHLIALMLTITGVLFIIRPTFLFGLETNLESLFHINLTHNYTQAEIKSHHNRDFIETVFGVILVLISAFCMSISQVTIRKLCLTKVHFSIISIYPALIGLPVSVLVSIMLFVTKQSHTEIKELQVLPFHLLYSFISGIFGTIALIFLNLALKYEDATKIGMVKTMGVFFSFLLQYLILKIEVDFLGILGAVFIVSGTILIMIIKIGYQNIQNSNNWFLKFFSMKF